MKNQNNCDKGIHRKIQSHKEDRHGRSATFTASREGSSSRSMTRPLRSCIIFSIRSYAGLQVRKIHMLRDRVEVMREMSE